MTRPVSFLSIRECGGVMGTAVVIDVFRAFTTAAWALHLGAEKIVLVDDLDHALELKARIPGSLALKDQGHQPGFDLDNSPVHLQQNASIAGRTIVQRTTAGTAGAVAARHAERLFCASFVCAAATAREIRRLDGGPLNFVVTGGNGKAEEDRACAEYIAAILDDPGTDPTPFLDRAGAAWESRPDVRERRPDVDPADVGLCLDVDRFDFAMRATDEDGLLVLRAI